MEMSEQCDEIFKAMAIAQGEMTPAIKDSTNPHFRSKYSDLNSVWAAIRAPLSKNGISVFQDVITTQTGVSVTTLLGHSSKQWIKFGPLEIPLIKRDAHGIGSATSYAKRYALCAIVGVSSEDEDDDGNSAIVSNGAPRPSGPILISKDQAQVLNDTLNQCHPEYYKEVLNHLKSQGILSINQLPISLYDRVLNAAKSKRMEKANALPESE